MRIVAVASQKGGVGKSTTALALSHALAMRGHVTALVDLDSQGNASACISGAPAPGVFRLLMGLASIEDVLIEARPNLWLLPGDGTTAELKLTLAGKPYRERLLARALDSLTADYCIIDTGPGRDLLHDLAHHAAGQVIVPAAVDHWALVGALQEIESLGFVRDNGHAIEVAAVVPTFWDSRTKESEINLARLVETFGELVLPAVPRTTKLREAPALGRTVWEHLPADHAACRAYTHLTERVLSYAR